MFDKSLTESFRKSEDVTNIRRENKAYSYKEQMEELELRKEIEAKRKKEGKYVEPKLTPKQKEMLAAQLEKESAIRKHVAQLVNSVVPVVRLLRASVQGCPKAFAHAIGSGEFMAVILKSLSSPIVADELMAVVRDLRKAVFDVETEQVSQVS